MSEFTVKLSYKGKTAYVDEITLDVTSTELLGHARKEFKIEKGAVLHLMYKGTKIAQEIMEEEGIVTYAHPAFPEGTSIGRMGAKVTVVGVKPIKKKEKDPGRFCDDGIWGKYDGDLDANGRRHGKGRMKSEDGEVYEGEWVEDKREGHGTCELANGAVYVGEFKKGKRDGRGTYYCNNGDKYIGDYKKDLRDGQGTYLLKNGDRYVGQYQAGKREGVGTFYWKDGCVDVGTFVEGKDCGDGVRWSKDRDTAYRLMNGKDTGEIELEMAEAFAAKLGFVDVTAQLAKLEVKD